MSSAAPTNTDNLDQPGFTIKVDGTALTPELAGQVIRIDVHEEIGRLARATVLIHNWDSERNIVTSSDAATFAPGKKIEIALGYAATRPPVFQGVVVGLGADFIVGQQPVLRIECRCKGALLTAARRSRVFEETADGDAASAIAGDYGLSGTTDAGAKGDVLVQDDMTDWDFLRARAERLGYALYVRDDKLVFGKPKASTAAVASLVYGDTLVELRIDQDDTSSPAKVTAAAWDPEGVEAATADADASDTSIPSGARPDVAGALSSAGWPKRDGRIAFSAAITPDELDLVAKGTVDRSTLAHISGRGRCHGLPEIRIDAVIELKGIGTRFAGKHYLTAVRHIFGSQVYTTEFQIGAPPRLRPAGAGDAEVRGPLLLGVVDDIDDPSKWGRVRVQLPWLDSEISSLWARLSLPAAGPDRGFFFIPEVGDEVVIGFLGDARHPVVLGSLWNGKHAPPESLDAEKNPLRSIVSRAGHRVSFDDSDDAPSLTLVTKAKQKVTLDDTSGSEKIELADKTGNKITLDSKGITLEAASGTDISLKASGGKVGIDAAQLEAKTSAAAKIQASSTLDLQASAALGLTGAMVKINS
jgi:Rhs element Vgr protein